jgi:hypothetical protein
MVRVDPFPYPRCARMLRRMIALAIVAGLAVTAPAALASPHLNLQMKNASATASRAAGGCSIAKGSHPGSLWVTCSGDHRATLTYVFSSARKVQGTPTRSLSYWGDWRHCKSTVKVTGRSLQVTVTVSGRGNVLLNTVSVGYYTG